MMAQVKERDGAPRRELWTAQVHLLTPPAPFGDTRCFSNVVAWGANEQEFGTAVSTIFARRQWTILGMQQCRRAAASSSTLAELSEQIEEAQRIPGSCIFGTLHYYPSKFA
jgi:hypothetical protein